MGSVPPSVTASEGAEQTGFSPIFSAFSGIRSHGLQHQLWLYQGYEPRHRTQQQSRPRQHTSLFLIASVSSDIPLSTGHNHSVSFSHFISYIYSPSARHHKVPGGPGFSFLSLRQTALSWSCAGPCFLFGAQGNLPHSCLWVFLFHSVHHQFIFF